MVARNSVRRRIAASGAVHGARKRGRGRGRCGRGRRAARKAIGSVPRGKETAASMSVRVSPMSRSMRSSRRASSRSARRCENARSARAMNSAARSRSEPGTDGSSAWRDLSKAAPLSDRGLTARQKAPQRFDQRGRAIFRKKQLRIRHLDDFDGAGNRVLQPIGPFQLEEDVVQSPDDQRRHV